MVDKNYIWSDKYTSILIVQKLNEYYKLILHNKEHLTQTLTKLTSNFCVHPISHIQKKLKKFIQFLYTKNFTYSHYM